MLGVLRNIGWLVGSRGVNAVLSLVYIALATRTLGLADFGRFALIVVLAQLVAGVASFQTWQAVVRWGVRDGEARTAAGFALALDLASFVPGAALAAALCWSAPAWLPLPADLRAPAFGLCLAALAAIRSTPIGVLRLHDRYDLAALAEAVLPATRAAGALAAAGLAAPVAGFVAAWACAELACAAAFWWFARPFGPVSRRDISLRAFPARHPGIWRFVWSTNLSRTLAVTARQAVLLLVGAFGGAAIAGGYRVAAQLGQALVQLAEAVSRAIYPELVRTQGGARSLAGRVTWLALLAGAVAVALAAALGGVALELLAGPAFAFAHAALAILALAGAIELLGASWDALLVARGRAATVLACRAAPLAIALAAMPWATGRLGITGVAACMAFASAASIALLAVAAGSPAGREAVGDGEAEMV